MSNLRTEQPVFETDRITDGFDIFFWVFNDASSFVATHWHTAIEIMYIIDGEVDVMMNQQTVILKPGDVFSDRFKASSLHKISSRKSCSINSASL